MNLFDCREGESLIIDHGIEVLILEVKEDCVRIAITSQEETPPYREETLYLNPADQELVLQQAY